MTVADRVVERFGSQRALALALGTKQSTVAYWVKSGRIPTKWHGELMTAAQERGVALEPADFVEAPTVEVLPDVPVALYEGELTLGHGDDAGKVRCYVLSDGRRVISRTSATGALTGASGGDLKAYVKPVASFLSVNLDDELTEFKIEGVTNKRVFGVTAECFLAICKAYVLARDEGALTTDRQYEIAKTASAFLAACATVGLIALIDEATGYQYDRAEDALRVKLRAYLEEEMRPWEKTFPDELWIEFGRLTGWQGSVQNRPKYWGKLVMELVYGYLDPDVANWLKENAPRPRHGQNYHQWLSSQYGLKKLIEHIWMLIGMASACNDIGELRYRMALKYGKHPVQITMFLDPPRRRPG